jgi:hypothetical protein
MAEGSLKARESQGSTRGLWKLGYMALPKFREALTRVRIRLRFKGNILIKEVNPLKGPRDSVRPGTYREALIGYQQKSSLS